MTKDFEITFKCPQTRKIKTYKKTFEDTTDFSAKEWANHYGNSISSGGSYEVQEVENAKRA